MPQRTASQSIRSLWLPFLLCLLGLGLRLLRLDWQPLWWDEGYSVWFATEPLAQMFRLTAQDIHPPLYYALLHFWLTGFGAVSPLLLRAFSVLIGLLSLPVIWWLARTVAPGRVRVARLALLLLAVSPIHIFYSQEVRMYGLEMLLGMVSTGLFWGLGSGGRKPAGRRSALWVGYVATTALLLYTEYYAVLLPLGHCIWALWHFRGNPRHLLPFLAGWMGVALLYLPWLIYAVPQLIPYVSQKIVEDADKPLGLLAYLLRHLLAFASGHIQPEIAWQGLLRWLAPGSLLILLAAPILSALTRHRTPIPNPQSPIPFLSLLLLLPTAIGYLLNLRLPFFPEGGERVLLFVLPYFLLLAAVAIDQLLATGGPWARIPVGLAMVGLLTGTATGVWAFYTTPRYVQDDYRPLIRQTVQQGSDTDTVLAVFPWQVGYWRAYAPVWGRGELHGPWPLLTPSTAWDESVRAALDRSLVRGKLWFPAHLSLGGILEGNIEAYLRGVGLDTSGRAVVNFENRWYSQTTRLSGWSRASAPVVAGTPVDFAGIRLGGFGLGQPAVESANQVVAVDLAWAGFPTGDVRVSLRLQDAAGRVFAQRDYAPLGSWPPAGDVQPGVDRVGLLLPPGLPPGEYGLALGVGPLGEELLFPVNGMEGATGLTAIGRLAVAAPAQPLPALRLPIQRLLAAPENREGIDFLGISGFDAAATLLAGAELNLSLFAQANRSPTADWELYFSVLDSHGGGVAGWEGWPLPANPAQSWPPGSQYRLPVSFFLPAHLSPGRYRLVSGLRNPTTGEKSAPVELGTLAVERRAANFTPPQPHFPLEQPALFGSHATLLGYDRTSGEDGTLLLTLYWRVEQTLLPPHHVFVHLRDSSGHLLAQDDAPPGRGLAPAPSNTWQPGEYISDLHRLSLPADRSGLLAQVGLYAPSSGLRLPVNVNGEIVGDTFPIPIE